MHPQIDKLFYFILSGIIQVRSDNQVLNFNNTCNSLNNDIHGVSSTKTYDVVFSGTNPPERCKIGFYQGPDGEVCLEATSYDVSDCDIQIIISSDSPKSYSCKNQPSMCTGYGSTLHITLTTTFPRKAEYGYSSFTLHIFQGSLKQDVFPILPTATGVITVLLFIVFMILCLFCTNRRNRRNSAKCGAGAMQHGLPNTGRGATAHSVSARYDTNFDWVVLL